MLTPAPAGYGSMFFRLFPAPGPNHRSPGSKRVQRGDRAGLDRHGPGRAMPHVPRERTDPPKRMNPKRTDQGIRGSTRRCRAKERAASAPPQNRRREDGQNRCRRHRGSDVSEEWKRVGKLLFADEPTGAARSPHYRSAVPSGTARILVSSPSGVGGAPQRLPASRGVWCSRGKSAGLAR